MRLTIMLASALLCFFLLPCAAVAAECIKLSSTIGPVDAGIVPLLAETYEKKNGVKVTYEKAGTGATLEKAKTGGFDLVMVHARRLEDKFIADGYGLERFDIMYNDFVILGPKNDPAKIKGMKSAPEAFAKLAKEKALFISRDDMSGTHVKELEIWEKAGIKPDETWYERFADGKKGNKATTLHTEAKQAYTLMDRATYLTLKQEITLVPLVEKDEIMLNLIAVIGVNPKKIQGANEKASTAFITWLRDDEAQGIIETFGVDKYGEPLFFPNAKKP